MTSNIINNNTYEMVCRNPPKGWREPRVEVTTGLWTLFEKCFFSASAEKLFGWWRSTQIGPHPPVWRVERGVEKCDCAVEWGEVDWRRASRKKAEQANKRQLFRTSFFLFSLKLKVEKAVKPTTAFVVIWFSSLNLELKGTRCAVRSLNGKPEIIVFRRDKNCNSLLYVLKYAKAFINLCFVSLYYDFVLLGVKFHN